MPQAYLLHHPLQTHPHLTICAAGDVEDFEADVAGHREHVVVVGQYGGGDGIQAFVAADLHEHVQELATESVTLAFVGDGQGEFCFVGLTLFAEPSDAENLAPAGLRVRVLDDERHLAVVIDEADAREAFVGDALLQFQRREVAVVNAPVAQLLVELHHQRLVLGPNRADGHVTSVFQLPRRDVARGIWADGGAGELRLGRARGMQHHAGIECEQAVR